MTEKIFYSDSYLKSFDAEIMEQRESSEGLWLTLNRTIFYPGGGGQLPDKGRIMDARLISLKEEDDIIWHLVERNQPFTTGSKVRLELDWPWRHYHMQQHSGQHLISHVLFDQGLKTVSVHLGETYTLIETEGPFPAPETLQLIESETNRIIREARPIKTMWVDRDSIARLPLRKPAGDWKNLRVIEIEGLDYSACGGTHVKNTAEIGLVKCTGIEKIRGHARLKFVIGAQADQYFNQLHTVGADLKDALETDFDQFISKIEGFKAELLSRKKETEFYRRTFIDSKSREIAAEYSDRTKPIVFSAGEGTYDDWKQIAKTLANDYGKVVFIIFERRFVLVTPDHDSFNTGEFLSRYGAELNLRGGGPPGFVQGSVGEPDEERIRAAVSGFKNNSKLD